jgi:hypothetical protein
MCGKILVAKAANALWARPFFDWYGLSWKFCSREASDFTKPEKWNEYEY